MASFQLKKFRQQDELIEHLAAAISQRLRQGITARQRAAMVVSGGKTPIPLFSRLAATPLHWDKVFITLADERWVATDSEDSNELLVHTFLLQHAAATAQFIGLKTEHLTPQQAEHRCSERLTAIQRPFDLVVLGMGNDGHTASLFPHAPELGPALDPDSAKTCIGINPGSAQHQRMSLTLPALLNTRHLFLHLSGEEKYEVLQRAIKGESVDAMPIRAILNTKKRIPISIYWAP